MNFQFNDGGRAAAGYKGRCRDCVVRAICIASRLPYDIVYDEMYARAEEFGASGVGAEARYAARKPSPRFGVHRQVYGPFLLARGWRWVATGSGIRLCASNLPAGRLIVYVRNHLVAVIDGVIYDTHECSRGGKRRVLGYYVRAA